MLFPRVEGRIHELKWCDGFNGEMMWNLCQHENFDPACRDFGIAFRSAEAEATGDINIHIFCRQGYHRSVSLACLVDSYLTDAGFQVTTRHLARELRGPCGCPANCRRASAEQKARWFISGTRAMDVAAATLSELM